MPTLSQGVGPAGTETNARIYGGAMIQIAMIETNKAARLMKALCNHFARKITARYEGDKGFIEFKDGKCELTSTSSMLKFQVQAETFEGLDHVKRAVTKHLEHFTPGEEIQFSWKEPS
jgi:hypothetical protein